MRYIWQCIYPECMYVGSKNKEKCFPAPFIRWCMYVCMYVYTCIAVLTCGMCVRMVSNSCRNSKALALKMEASSSKTKKKSLLLVAHTFPSISTQPEPGLSPSTSFPWVDDFLFFVCCFFFASWWISCIIRQTFRWLAAPVQVRRY